MDKHGTNGPRCLNDDKTQNRWCGGPYVTDDGRIGHAIHAAPLSLFDIPVVSRSSIAATVVCLASGITMSVTI